VRKKRAGMKTITNGLAYKKMLHKMRRKGMFGSKASDTRSGEDNVGTQALRAEIRVGGNNLESSNGRKSEERVKV